MLGHGVLLLGALVCASGYIIGSFTHLQLEVSNENGLLRSIMQDLLYIRESVMNDKEDRVRHPQHDELDSIKGYRMFDGHYYKLVKSPGRNWAEARESCQEDGGDLAVIDSQEEADFLLQLFSKDPSRWDQYVYEAFVGVTDQASEGNFLTVNGSSLNNTGFDHWLPNEPNNGDGVRSSEEDCVTFHKGRAYNDVDCDREMPYFCEKLDKQNSGESAQTDKEDREHHEQLEDLNIIGGYRMFDGRYYKLVKSPGRNWAEARESCQEDGGDLAVIDSQEEADFLLQLFSKDPSRWDQYVYEAFVGVTDQASEGNFLTVNGSTLNSTGFDHWMPNEPNNGDGVRSSEEDCVTFHKGRAYNDVDCDREIPYFCEKVDKQNSGESAQMDKEVREHHESLEDLNTIGVYRIFDGHYYKLVKSPGLDWIDARKSCQEDGGDLAVIDSQEEADFLLQLFSKDPSRWDRYVYEAFVGVTDQALEGNFLTVNGSTLNSTGFDHWMPNEPNNGDGVRSSGEDCVTFHKGRAYNDVDCDRKIPYFCEKVDKQNSGESAHMDKEVREHHESLEDLNTIGVYRIFDGHYYKLVKSPGLDWIDARKSCQEDGGDLAVIDSQEEADFLLQLFSKDPSRWDRYVYEAFVGVTDQASEGNFLTVNGSTLNSTGFDHWLPNEPNNGDGVRSSGEDCVTFHKGRAYNDVDCDRKIPYFCEKVDEQNSGESAQMDKEVREHHEPLEDLNTIGGYRMFDGHYYKLVKSPGRNWAEARESCQEDGGDLAVIDSQEEADFLLQLFSKDPSRWDRYVYEAFVGVTDQASEGNFLTINGSSLNSTGFDHWMPNEPNNGDGVRSSEEDCVTFHKGRAYNDVDCDREIPYFCEVEERNLLRDEMK